MLCDIFPKTLAGLIGRTFPRHRFSTAMLPLITLENFAVEERNTAPRHRLLGAEELHRAASYRIAKRRNEWLTGRVCAKLAARRFLPAGSTEDTIFQPDCFTIANDTSGRPAFSGSLPQSLLDADLSISHGGGFAMALVADSRCGVDIQRPRETLLRVREKFCAVTEEELLGDTFCDLSEIQQLTLLWSAKEAAKKALGFERMPGFLEILLSGREPHADGWVLNFLISSREFDGYPSTISIACELYEEYAIAVCLTEESSRA